MRRDDVYLVSDKLRLATTDQIRAAEQALGTRFPAGYREYVTTLGAGSLNGRARIVPPSEIVDQTVEFRDRMHVLFGEATDGYDPFQLFETGLDLLPPDRLFQCILVIDAGDGHEIIYHPDTPDALFLLPHEQDGVYSVGRTIDAALTTFLGNDLYTHETQVLTREGRFEDRLVRYFEPDRLAERAFFRLDPTVPYHEIRAHLVGAALEQPAGSLMVREPYLVDDGTERENLFLFVHEYGGALGTSDWPVQADGIGVIVRFDDDQRTERLEHTLGFLRSRARTVTYNAGEEAAVEEALA